MLRFLAMRRVVKTKCFLSGSHYSSKASKSQFGFSLNLSRKHGSRVPLATRLVSAYVVALMILFITATLKQQAVTAVFQWRCDLKSVADARSSVLARQLRS